MAYLLVFLIAAIVGVAVYAISLRAPSPTPAGADPRGRIASEEVPEGYVAVSGWRPDWQSRLTGLMGLFVAVVLGAIALAVATYAGFAIMFKAIGGLVGD